jgi:WD40 repeat protein
MVNHRLVIKRTKRGTKRGTKRITKRRTKRRTRSRRINQKGGLWKIWENSFESEYREDKSQYADLTLSEHSGCVNSVAWCPWWSLLATGSSDNTVKLWRFSDDGLKAACTATLEGHSSPVTSLAFHPSLPLLATCSGIALRGGPNGTLKLWYLSANLTDATCVETLEGIEGHFTSVAFHPRLPLLVSCGHSRAVKLWLLSYHVEDSKSDILSNDETVRKGYGSKPLTFESATCVATLEGHSLDVRSVAFHPTRNLMASGSYDGHVILWSFSDDGSNAKREATLEGNALGWVYTVAFHPTEPLLAIGGWWMDVIIWRFSPDVSKVNEVARIGVLHWKLESEKDRKDWVRSIAFHPNLPLMATGSVATVGRDGIEYGGTVKIWQLSLDRSSADESSATCVSILKGHNGEGPKGDVTSVAFDPTHPLIATGGADNTVRIYKIIENKTYFPRPPDP